jgi:serralysin
MINFELSDSNRLRLSSTLQSTLKKLWLFLEDPEFADKMSLVFGSSWNTEAASLLLNNLSAGKALPTLQIVSASALKGAMGAYDAANTTIYLSQDLLETQANNSDAIERVLLEEFGHYIDSQINTVDAAGDEGAIFAAIVQGHQLSASELAALKAENDHGTITIDGKTNAVEFAASYGTVTLDGNLSDWTAADRLDFAPTGQPGFELYGKYTGNAYVFAIKSSTVAIGAGTTLWLNTDQNASTGYQIFGNLGGAEYNVNFFTDSKPYLYTGADGQNFVSALDYAYDATSQTVEFAVPASLLANAPQAVNVLADINNQVFLPGDYTATQYTVSAVPPPPVQTVFGNVTLDGNATDWTSADRIDFKLGTSQPGFEVYGKYAGNAYVLAIKSTNGTAIGAKTTAWLNTDRNALTGYQIFGVNGTGGAEYNVNFAIDSKPYLYTGAAGQTQVGSGALPYAFSSNNQFVELAIPVSGLAGNPQAIDLLLDVNDQTFLPGNYASNNYTVFANQTLPTRTDTSKRIGIVYSETSANKYFDKTAYSQLFMSVQNQARMAGIPFDLLTENDLTDINKLVNYDTLVFPSFRNVPQAKLQSIQDTLTTAVYKFGTGLVAAGDFLTNDETGALLAGDPYQRMKTLLDVTRTTGGTAANVTLQAETVSHSAMQGYAANEVIHNYTNIGWSAFSSVSNPATVLVDQTIAGQTYNAVLATQTGGRNIHYATESYLADNNLLWQSLRSEIFNDQPSVGLHMSRNQGIFVSRVDMDQSQEYEEVKPANGSAGIYDKLLPILDQWKQAYNFVGSYYVNIGNNPSNGQYTDWTVSKPYYNRLLASGNEIGTHSYTHLVGYTPAEDTNILTPAQIEFEFNQSKQVISQQLGIAVTGAAVPGAPEKLPTSTEISKYFNYITGGYSSVGAGYPSAFGYLVPGSQTVYLAPNISFDFTLIEFKKLTAPQAEAAWAAEYAGINQHADQAIVMLPWHDYGPTNWSSTGTGPGYTQAMFTNFIGRAYNDRTEFVTLDDLSQRIQTFQQSKLSVQNSGNTITATVGSNVATNNVGKFSLDVNSKLPIQNVANWYAYDTDTVFLPKAGGQFVINLGAAQDDVTHITELPMRSELLSVSGDGQNLSFSFIGDGKAFVDLKNPAGFKVKTVGADRTNLVGEILELDFNTAGQHTASISFGPDAAPTVVNPIAAVSVNEDAPNTVIDLTNVFTDADDPLTGITKAVLTNSNASMVSTTLVGNTLTLKYLLNQFGAADITVRGTSAGKTVDTTFKVNVAPVDDAPVVLTPIANVTVTENSPATTINLSSVFTDVDNDPAAIVKTVTSNSNSTLLSTAISNNTLTLNYLPNQYGTAQVTVQGTSNGKTVTNTFAVTVNSLYNIINGTGGNDTLTGTTLKDRIFGLSGNDIIRAQGGDDLLFGGDGTDQLFGNAGNDTLTGGRNNDQLSGEDGNDILIGVDPTLPLAGRGEVDVLTGGNQADRFILGDSTQVYYNDNNATNTGTADYARITDFSPSQGDVIQLKGTAANYRTGLALVGLNLGQGIYLKSTAVGVADELIGLVQGTTTASLTSSAFSYV